MRESVEEYINQCSSCAQRKTRANPVKAPLQSIEVGEPFTFWAMDFVGPLPETSRRNRHILVMMDHFTKWCEAFPTKDQKAATVANLVVGRVFSRFGPPVILHSDQGANFESNLIHQICDRPDDWDLWFDPVVYAYNSSRQESLGTSPYEVVFGRVPCMPLELELGVPVSNPASR